MSAWITWVGGMLALVGAILGGAFQVDERYAKADDVQQQVGEVKQLYLKSERRDLARQRFDIEVTKQRRALTQLENKRARELDQEQKEIDMQIQQLGRKKP